MRYTNRAPRRRWPRRLLLIIVIGVVVVIGATIAVRYVYNANLKPVSNNSNAQEVVIKQGASVDEIGKLLQDKGLIRSAWAFRLYVSSKEARSELQAGTYSFAPNEDVAEIVSSLTHGKITTNLVTILPGQRLDQIRKHLIDSGFSEAAVDDALNPDNYTGNPAIVDKPAAASLEGYLYPNSYERTADTNPKTIVEAALDQMDKQLTPDLRQAFARQGLSTYQGIVLASVVEKEVSTQSDRDQVAQVFIKRIHNGMRLQSDITAFYGAILAGKPLSVNYDSAYNTYMHDGLPPTPVSNVSISSLRAVAYPANTDWLYFVAGDDGTTHFAKTIADHQANVAQYCKKLCSQ